MIAKDWVTVFPALVCGKGQESGEGGRGKKVGRGGGARVVGCGDLVCVECF